MWTENQITRIKSAVKAGRAAISKRNIDAFVFADAFVKLGGIQVPGMPFIDEGTLRRIGSHVLANIIEGKGPRITPGEPDWFFDAMAREMNRSFSEAYWFSAAQHTDVVGFRLKIYENVADIEDCESFAKCDSFGLGAGIFPKDEIVILPTCCDRASFEVVFKDEINSIRNARSI